MFRCRLLGAVRRLAGLVALAALAVPLTACNDDDDEHGATPSTPTSKGACADSYFEDRFSSSDDISLLLATDHVVDLTVTELVAGALSTDLLASDVTDLWSRPSAPNLPERLVLPVISCQVGFEWQEGHRYLVNVVWQPADGVWGVVSHEGMLLYDGGVIGDLDRPRSNGAWGDRYAGQHADALVSGLDDARASYEHLLDLAWRQPDPQRRTSLYTTVHDPRQRSDPGARRTEASLGAALRAARPGLHVVWHGRVLRQHMENSTIGEVTLGEASARATWWQGFPGGAEVHRATLGGREVWVVRCPDFVGLHRTLVVAIAPDGWSLHTYVARSS